MYSVTEKCMWKIFQSNCCKLKQKENNFERSRAYPLHSGCCAPDRYNAAIIESIIAMILIDILDAIVRYRIGNDGGRDLEKIK